MILDHSYIQGSNPECNQTPGGPPIGGNGSNGCLKGWLTQILTTGTVDSDRDDRNRLGRSAHQVTNFLLGDLEEPRRGTRLF